MGFRRIDDANAFVVTDLDAMGRHAGVARCAPKVLTDSTWLLARCATYQFALLDLEVGGTSVGISAPAPDRDTSVAAAVAALAAADPPVLVLDAGRGLTDGDLAGLHAVDGRPEGFAAMRAGLVGAGIAAAADTARPLDGATVAMDTVDATSVAFAHEAVRRGARLVGVTIGGTAVMDPAGIDPSVLDAVVGSPAAADGDSPTVPGTTVEPAELVAAGVDVLAVGAKPGAIDHNIAAGVSASMVVPTAWVPVTTRALAVLTRKGVTVLPDFAALAGAVPASGLAGTPVTAGEATAAGMQLVADVVAAVLADVGGDWPNAVLAACNRAEASLVARGHELPTSRPLG